jgi:hypothetical protein
VAERIVHLQKQLQEWKHTFQRGEDAERTRFSINTGYAGKEDDDDESYSSCEVHDELYRIRQWMMIQTVLMLCVACAWLTPSLQLKGRCSLTPHPRRGRRRIWRWTIGIQTKTQSVGERRVRAIRTKYQYLRYTDLPTAIFIFLTQLHKYDNVNALSTKVTIMDKLLSQRSTKYSRMIYRHLLDLTVRWCFFSKIVLKRFKIWPFLNEIHDVTRHEPLIETRRCPKMLRSVHSSARRWHFHPAFEILTRGGSLCCPV